MPFCLSHMQAHTHAHKHLHTLGRNDETIKVYKVGVANITNAAVTSEFPVCFKSAKSDILEAGFSFHTC